MALIMKTCSPSLHPPQRVRVVIENWTPAGTERVEGPWRTVPPWMLPEKVNEALFRAALGDFATVTIVPVAAKEAAAGTPDTTGGS